MIWLLKQPTHKSGLSGHCMVALKSRFLPQIFEANSATVQFLGFCVLSVAGISWWNAHLAFSSECVSRFGFCDGFRTFLVLMVFQKVADYTFVRTPWIPPRCPFHFCNEDRNSATVFEWFWSPLSRIKYGVFWPCCMEKVLVRFIHACHIMTVLFNHIRLVQYIWKYNDLISTRYCSLSSWTPSFIHRKNWIKLFLVRNFDDQRESSLQFVFSKFLCYENTQHTSIYLHCFSHTCNSNEEIHVNYETDAYTSQLSICSFLLFKQSAF